MSKSTSDESGMDETIQMNAHNQTYENTETRKMGPLSTKLGLDVNENSGQAMSYFGVYIPPETQMSEEFEALHVYSDKAEALKIVKKHKKARFKAFKSRQEAVNFTVHGPDVAAASPIVSEGDVPPAVGGEKPCPFKGPRSQDMVRLRKSIECGDVDTVQATVWDNPRYLVSSGDTPAILQEGSRYNALHVAAKSGSAMMCELILRTVGDPTFAQLLYADDNPGSCQRRAHVLLDLYLNTPDKGLNETPLHFAVKFGAVEAVEMLVQYPQCDRSPRNKFGQTPRDMVCSRVCSPDAALKARLYTLLGDRFYVPVLRSEDNSVQPTVGPPFSPTSPPVLNTHPLEPRLEIRAYAGPMDQQQASVFHRKWKTPPRALRGLQTPGKESPTSHAFRLTDADKGLERVGRNLAQEFQVEWSEFWPFLGTFLDLSSMEGLTKLEAYLKKKFQQTEKLFFQPPEQNKDVFGSGLQFSVNGRQGNPEGAATACQPSAVSPITDLCLSFQACRLSDAESADQEEANPCRDTRTVTYARTNTNTQTTENDALMAAMTNPVMNPFLYIEKSCEVFAKRIYDGLLHISLSATDTKLRESVREKLVPEMEHLRSLVSSFMDDVRFVSVDFHLLHSRLSMMVGSKLQGLPAYELNTIMSGLEALLLPDAVGSGSSDEDDDMYRPPRRRAGPCSLQQARCVAQQLLRVLQSSREQAKGRVSTEAECMAVWADADRCSCQWNSRRGTSFRRNHKPSFRRLDFDRDWLGVGSMADSGDQELSLRQAQMGMQGQPYHEKMPGAGSSHMATDDEDNDVFYTPPTSADELSNKSLSDESSDEAMVTPDEGVDVFIEGDRPTRMDVSVMQAIEKCRITSTEFPNVYRWRHLVLLHSEKERECWPSPHSNQQQRRKVSTPTQNASPRPYTPTERWHRVTGPYSPSTPLN